MHLPEEHLAAFIWALHLAAHLEPHLAMALGAHLTWLDASWAAAGKAKVAAVKAARDASFRDVFIVFPHRLVVGFESAFASSEVKRR